ncbi:MAG: hypothetical protein QOD82_1575 [Pseudonocardiales bacterium]|jgi:hypothetical protein|nr:hypothetical protein [Pseudonocardiales bacterium]MDT7673673.1 hypothetical protein [Pseudonocardiales bacterium]
MAAVSTNAMVMMRGSWRAGSRSRAVSGAMASQPTKDSISTEAALPTDAQPCGANGVQLVALAADTDPSTATSTRPISTATSTNCAVVVVRAPPNVSASTTPSSSAAAATLTVRPPPSSTPT